jgi:hypothetical protein
MTQTAYIEKIIKTYNLKSPKIRRISIQQRTYFTKKTTLKPDEEQKMKYVPYREAIGSLLYVATYTRPEITFVVCALARFVANPKYDY